LKFTTKEISKLTEVTPVNIAQQKKLGFYNPTISISTGKGSSKNFWSLADGYIIRTINDLIASGWSRKKAAAFIQAIDLEGLADIIAIGVHSRWRMMNFDFISHVTKDNLAKKLISSVKGGQSKVDIVRELMVDGIMQSGSDVGIWLVFGRFDQKIYCLPAVEEDQRIEGLQLSEDFGYNNVLARFKTADEIYVYRLSRAMDKIDLNLIKFFPSKAAEHSKSYFKQIDDAIKNSNDKIKSSDFIGILSRIISGGS